MISVVLVAYGMMFSGCHSSSSDNGPATLSSITVSPASAPTVTVGATQQFTASGVMSDGTATAVVVSWATSSAGVATISATGLATAVSAGTTTITATEAGGTINGTATMTVVVPTYAGTFYQASQNGGHIAVYSVTIDPSNAASPIVVNTTTASKIQLNGAPSDSANHTVFHDIKFDDDTNPTKIYYAAIMSRPGTTGVGDIGYVDLTQANTAGTNNGINSVIQIDAGRCRQYCLGLESHGTR